MDFLGLLEEYYKSPENVRNPVSKVELLCKIPRVLYHRTIIGDETLSIPKETKFKNIPSKLRLTTICVITCSLRRKKKQSEGKYPYTIDMFMSEIIYGDSRLFRRHFYHAGILMESSNLDSCVKAMSDMGIVWPDRRDGKVIDSIPKFTFESSVPKEFKNCFLHNNKESKYEVDELVRYIEGLPCLLAPREPKPDFVPQNGIFWSDIVDED